MSHRASPRLVLAVLSSIGILLSSSLAHAAQLPSPLRPAFSLAFDSSSLVHDFSDPVMSRLSDPVMRRLLGLSVALPDTMDSPERVVGESAGTVTGTDEGTEAVTLPARLAAWQQPWLTFGQTSGVQPVDGLRITEPSFSARGSRPAVLLPLYASFAVLQILDGASTLKVIENGGREANPTVAPFTSSPAALYGVKAATAVGTIVVAEAIWKRSRTAAVVTMVALNVGIAMVARHNYRVAGQ